VGLGFLTVGNHIEGENEAALTEAHDEQGFNNVVSYSSRPSRSLQFGVLGIFRLKKTKNVVSHARRGLQKGVNLAMRSHFPLLA